MEQPLTQHPQIPSYLMIQFQLPSENSPLSLGSAAAGDETDSFDSYSVFIYFRLTDVSRVQ